jgi:hypothetical protein
MSEVGKVKGLSTTDQRSKSQHRSTHDRTSHDPSRAHLTGHMFLTKLLHPSQWFPLRSQKPPSKVRCVNVVLWIEAVLYNCIHWKCWLKKCKIVTLQCHLQTLNTVNDNTDWLLTPEDQEFQRQRHYLCNDADQMLRSLWSSTSSHEVQKTVALQSVHSWPRHSELKSGFPKRSHFLLVFCC